MKMVLKFLFSFTVAVLLLYGLWLFAGFIFDWAAELDKEVAATAIASLVGLFGILYAQWYSKSKEISDNHRPAKIEVYETFFDLVEHFMASEETEGKSLNPEDDSLSKDLKDQFTKLSRGIIVWASPQVIKAWGEFREQASANKTTKDSLLAVDKVLQAIRADLGNSNFGLGRGEVVKLYLSNPGEVDV